MLSPMPASATKAARRGPPEKVQIAFLLTRLGTRQATAFTELLRPIGLRPKQFAVMNVVALADGPSQQEVGAQMELDPSGLIATIDELEARGWLERRRSERDRRRHALYLTASGDAKLAEGRQAARSRAEELTSALDPEEQTALLDLLRKLL
jgi:DNA-binding MarR family transcriptional regulator